MKTFKTFWVAMALVASIPFATAQTADEIVNNYFENTGGMDAWTAIKSVEFTGDATMGPQKFPFTQTVVADGRMAILIDLQGQKFTPQAFDGEQSWGTNFQTMAAEASDSETSTNYKNNDAKEFPDPFLNYADNGYSVALEGEETKEGVETYKVKLTKNPVLVDGASEENVVYYFFDKENFVPIASEQKIQSGPQKGMTVQTLFSDYQEAGNVFMAFTMNVKYDGQLGQTIAIKDVTINPEVDETIFKMPVKADTTTKN